MARKGSRSGLQRRAGRAGGQTDATSRARLAPTAQAPGGSRQGLWERTVREMKEIVFTVMLVALGIAAVVWLERLDGICAGQIPPPAELAGEPTMWCTTR